jgi:hypothetical protein
MLVLFHFTCSVQVSTSCRQITIAPVWFIVSSSRESAPQQRSRQLYDRKLEGTQVNDAHICNCSECSFWSSWMTPYHYRGASNGRSRVYGPHCIDGYIVGISRFRRFSSSMDRKLELLVRGVCRRKPAGWHEAIYVHSRHGTECIMNLKAHGPQLIVA